MRDRDVVDDEMTTGRIFPHSPFIVVDEGLCMPWVGSSRRPAVLCCTVPWVGSSDTPHLFQTTGCVPVTRKSLTLPRSKSHEGDVKTTEEGGFGESTSAATKLMVGGVSLGLQRAGTYICGKHIQWVKMLVSPRRSAALSYEFRLNCHVAAQHNPCDSTTTDKPSPSCQSTSQSNKLDTSKTTTCQYILQEYLPACKQEPRLS